VFLAGLWFTCMSGVWLFDESMDERINGRKKGSGEWTKEGTNRPAYVAICASLLYFQDNACLLLRCVPPFVVCIRIRLVARLPYGWLSERHVVLRFS